MSGTIIIDSAALLKAIRQKIVKEPEVRVQPYDYIIWTDGSNIYGKNTISGEIDITGTDIGAVINAALNNLPKVKNPQSGRMVPNGKIFIKAGVYHGTQTIFIYDDWFVEIEGELPNDLNNQWPNFEGAPDSFAGGTIINIESQYGAVSLQPYPGGEDVWARAQVISLKNLNFYMKNANITDPYNYAILNFGPWRPYTDTTPTGKPVLKRYPNMVFLENISVQDYSGRNPALYLVNWIGYDEIIYADRIFVFGKTIPIDQDNCPSGAPNASLYAYNPKFGYFSLSINGIDDPSIPSKGDFAYALYWCYSQMATIERIHLFGNPNGLIRFENRAEAGNRAYIGELHAEVWNPPNGYWSYAAPWHGLGSVVIGRYKSSHPELNPISLYGAIGNVAFPLDYYSEVIDTIVGNAQFGLPYPSIPENPPVTGKDYRNTNYMTIAVYVPVTLNPTPTSPASAGIQVGRDTSTYATLDSVALPAGATPGYVYTLKAIVPAGYYFRVNASNATIGRATAVKA